ncbi:MAG: hypothetical protein D6781_13490 [Verrucomicrobia bacterium]|nr:MAG: hypothetical protein D6781_13490 [Verrucomicrobiota bacterium]
MSAIIVTLSTFSFPAEAQEEIYFNDFEGAVGAEWSHRTTDRTPVGARRFLGQFGNGSVTLTLHKRRSGRVSVTFDLYLINSWDGNNPEHGPDLFEVTVASNPLPSPPASVADFKALLESGVFNSAAWGNPFLLYTTFSNLEEKGFTQSYPSFFGEGDHPPGSGALEYDTLGYSYFGDSVYRLSFSFEHPAGDLILQFTALALQDMSDESWGLDNVRVEGASVPEKIDVFRTVKIIAPRPPYGELDEIAPGEEFRIEVELKDPPPPGTPPPVVEIVHPSGAAPLEISAAMTTGDPRIFRTAPIRVVAPPP